MRETFHRELNELDTSLITLVNLCEQAIEAAVKVLLANKEEKLRNVISIRDKIDQEAYAIEDSCMKMLIRQQPLAKDMNMIAYSLKLIRDMERIGTQAVELAAIAKDIKPQHMQCSEIIHMMTDDAIGMLKDTVASYIHKDKNLAQDVIDRDDELDEAYLKVKSHLSDQIFLNPNQTSAAIDILMVAKYIERIGDHTVNIAHWIIKIIK